MTHGSSVFLNVWVVCGRRGVHLKKLEIVGWENNIRLTTDWYSQLAGVKWVALCLCSVQDCGGTNWMLCPIKFTF